MPQPAPEGSFFRLVPTPQTHAGRAHAWQEGSTNDKRETFHTAECSDDLTSMAKLILAFEQSYLRTVGKAGPQCHPSKKQGPNKALLRETNANG